MTNTLGSGMVEGQIEEMGHAFELLTPVVAFTLTDPWEVFVLPERVVRILHLQGWQGYFGILGGIEGGEFAEEDAEGPAIANDVVHGEEQTVILWTVGNELNTPERSSFEVEVFESIAANGFIKLDISENRKADVLVRKDLEVVFALNCGEVAAQGFVTEDKMIECGFKTGHVEVAA